MQADGPRGKRQLFQDKELIKKLCNDPKLYYSLMVECSEGRTDGLKAIVEDIPEDLPDFLSPSKKERKAASTMAPGEANTASSCWVYFEPSYLQLKFRLQ